MKVFQIGTLYPGAAAGFARKYGHFKNMSHAQGIQATIREGFDGCHILGPVFDQAPEVAFTWGDYEPLQKVWALEKGMPWTDAQAVTLAQIEEHGSEVLYSLDPLSFDSAFVRRLPGCVKRTLCWRAARRGGPDFSAYQIRLSNFPPINQAWEEEGLRAAYFSPSVDPTVGTPLPAEARDVDVCFVGSVTRSHTERIVFLDAIAALGSRHTVHLHLLSSLPTRVLSLPILRHLPGNRFAMPGSLQRHAKPPLFGQSMFQALKRAKVVINIALDTVGRPYRGNMRCFEVLSCGTALVTDEGRYPTGFEGGHTIVTYRDSADAVRRIDQVLAEGTWIGIGQAGRDMLERSYSKAAQWNAFQAIVASM